MNMKEIYGFRGGIEITKSKHTLFAVHNVEGPSTDEWCVKIEYTPTAETRVVDGVWPSFFLKCSENGSWFVAATSIGKSTARF